ncbi:MAG: glutathione S-transferase N-terminal domain-containing protein [Deltaproteobacteria bacterium]|nr:glutathione S-transferase N-terminal domain-containing protein [Deltaproteobacteria bacterium]
MKLKLYHYWRSSSSWRVRWAFALKKIPCEYVAIDLLKGEQKSEAHLKRNPLGAVPVLEISEGSGASKFLAESMAIMEWAEELYPSPKILPGDALQRGLIRQLSEVINSGTHPLQNLKVKNFYSLARGEPALAKVRGSAKALHPDNPRSKDPEKAKEWGQYWNRQGLQAYEDLVQETAGQFSVGDVLTMADLCLVPQCYNAQRIDISLEEFPLIAKIYAAALKTESSKASHPDQFQP